MWIVAGTAIEDWVHQYETYEEAKEYYDQCILEPYETIYIAEVKDMKERKEEPLKRSPGWKPIPLEKSSEMIEQYGEQMKNVLENESELAKILKRFK